MSDDFISSKLTNIDKLISNLQHLKDKFKIAECYCLDGDDLRLSTISDVYYCPEQKCALIRHNG
jgi:hypothetical protein